MLSRRGYAQVIEALGDELKAPALGTALEHPAHPPGLFGHNEHLVAVRTIAIGGRSRAQALSNAANHAQAMATLAGLILYLGDDPGHGLDDEARVRAARQGEETNRKPTFSGSSRCTSTRNHSRVRTYRTQVPTRSNYT